MMRYVLAAAAAVLIGTQANAQVVISTGYTYPSTVYTYSYATPGVYYAPTTYYGGVYTSSYYSPGWSGYYGGYYPSYYYGYNRGLYVSPRVGVGIGIGRGRPFRW